MNIPKLISVTTATTAAMTTTASLRPSVPIVTTAHCEQSLGPNLRSRLEALEAAMGVRLNVAKRQGRQSLSNTTSSSPMQISPTSTASNTISTTPLNSLSTSSRQNIPSRTGQGVQRSASSCDVENHPGPIKRLKPSVPMEQASASTVTAIATVKKYLPPVRRTLAAASTPTPISTGTGPTIISTSLRSSQMKQSTMTKPRNSPMDTNSSVRVSRSSIVSNTSSSTSSTTRTANNGSPKIVNRTSGKQRTTYVSPPPPPRPATFPRKQRVSIFGEQFSDDMLKTNLLWINLNELDDDARTEVMIQFGSIERFLHEQRLFTAKQQQLKLAAGNKNRTNRSRIQLLITKKDRLELL